METGEKFYGILGGADIPKEGEPFKIEIIRSITNLDIRRFPEKYTSEDLGMPTNGFNTIQTLKKYAYREFVCVFKNWQMKIENNT